MNYSLVSNSCISAFLYWAYNPDTHPAFVTYTNPFISSWFPDDEQYIKFCENYDYYVSLEPYFGEPINKRWEKETGKRRHVDPGFPPDYLVMFLGDIEIHWIHDTNEKLLLEKYKERLNLSKGLEHIFMWCEPELYNIHQEEERCSFIQRFNDLNRKTIFLTKYQEEEYEDENTIVKFIKEWEGKSQYDRIKGKEIISWYTQKQASQFFKEEIDKFDKKIKFEIVRTPIGEIASFKNDMFTTQLKEIGMYAEQEILDGVLHPVITKSKNILDIGGHVGYHSIAYAKYNLDAQIMTFEPQKNVFSLLQRNVKENGYENRIKTFNLAVGDKNRQTTLLNHITDGLNTDLNIEYGTDKYFNLGGVSIGFDGEVVEMITIDSLNLTALDFMKIDVEGAESLVLMGGENTIKKFKPIICFEDNVKSLSPEFIHHLGYDTLPSPSEILKSWGYTKIEQIPWGNFLASCDDIEIGVTMYGDIIKSIGDTICLSPVIEELSKQRNQKITVCTGLSDLFLHNPYVKEVITYKTPTTEIQVSPHNVDYSTNMAQLYAKQFNIILPENYKPSVYLSPEEIEYGKNELKEFDGYKKIAVSLQTSADVKNIRYEFISSLLDKLRAGGYVLIGVGKEVGENNYPYDKSYINKTTLREACSIIGACDLYLGADAGLYHIAAGLGIPQVVFFRNNQSSNNRYFNTYFLDSRIRCEEKCLTSHLHTCQNEIRCMDSFNLEAYHDLVDRALHRTSMISIREMNENDLPFFVEVRNSCAEEFLHDSRKFTLEDSINWFKTTPNKYYIINDYDDKIGYFRTSNYSAENKNIYIGSDLHEKWRGKGLAYEAYQKFISFLFNQGQYHKVSLEVISSNTRAINLYKKLGFVEEGRKRDEVKKGEKYVDSIVMSILEDEWNNRFMDKKTCYVINFYLGNRRYNPHRYYADKLCYVKSQIETLQKYKHSLSKIIFSFNVDPEHQELLEEALKIIPNKIQNTEVEVNIRENFGMSYAAWSEMFEKYMDTYDYYIFNEDDYLIVQDNFDRYLVQKFESLPNCGYLCGLVRELAHYKRIRHAGMSSGISSYKVLKRVYDKYGELPHSKKGDYLSNEKEGQTIQTVAIRQLGYEIFDIREEYRMKFWTGCDSEPEDSPVGCISVHFMWKNEDFFLPAKLYFGEAHGWTDRIDGDFLRMECNYHSPMYFRYSFSQNI